MSRKGGKRQDKECSRHLRGGGESVLQIVFLDRWVVTCIMVDLARESFVAKSVGVDEEGAIFSELIEFLIEIYLCFANCVLFYFLIGVLFVFPD